MSAAVQDLFRPRGGPRPDPLPARGGFPWRNHAAWIAALAATVLAYAALPARDLGLLACGAGLFAAASYAVRASVARACEAVHLAAGVCVLALAHDADAAGSYALAAGLLLSADLGARAASAHLRARVAPLAGQVPERFRQRYRDLALRFGGAGLAAGLLVVALGPAPEVRVVGVALLPLALRSFASNLLSFHAGRALWILAASAQVAALIAFVPQHGAVAAAWAAVAVETLLFAGSALAVTRAATAAAFPTVPVASMSAAGLLLCALAVPGSATWPLLVLLLFAAGCGALLYPTRR